MIRCNGYCSGRRATREVKTQAGGAAPSARRKMPSCDACVSTAVKSSHQRSLSSLPSPTITRGKTWTFSERTKHAANTELPPWRPRHRGRAMLTNSGPQELALLSIS